MPTAVQNGRAFEWATAESLSRRLHVPIVASSSATKASEAFKSLDGRSQSSFREAAGAAVEHILTIEGSNHAVIAAKQVEFSTDAAGQTGDVRDIVLSSSHNTLGFSCKNNHSALKHSRLSATIDFITDWGIDAGGSSDAYFDAIDPVFESLKKIKEASGGLALWREHEDVLGHFYSPILKAFQEELRRALGGPQAKIRCGQLSSYLIGNFDFYKIINRRADSRVEIQGWNLQSTLHVKQLHLPSALIDIRLSETSPSTTMLFLDRGFTFSFRVHNASSRIEPSLKFDINAVGIPPSLYVNHIFV